MFIFAATIEEQKINMPDGPHDTPPNLSVLEAEDPGRGVIERLEEALEQAREGKVSSVAIALVYRNGSTNTAWSHPPNMMLLAGAVHHLGWRLHAKLDAT